MNKMTDGTQWRDTRKGIVAVRGKRELHLLGTSVAAGQKMRRLLAEISFDKLYKASKPAPGMKNTRFLKVT